MTIRMSAAVRDGMMNGYETAIGTAPKLRIYTGAPPANLTDAATGTLLCEMTLPTDWMLASASGVIAKNGVWSGTAIQNGTAGYYRLLNSGATTVHEQGTVAAAGADMTINNASIATGQTITVTAFQKTASNP